MQHGVPCGKSTELLSIWSRKVCPYNESHSIGTGSYVAHVNKCFKALPPEVRAKYMECPYNSSHQFLKEVFEEHLATCEDRRLYEAEKFPATPEMFGKNAAGTWETPRDIRIRQQLEHRDRQKQNGAPIRKLTKVEGEQEYTEEEFEAFLNE